MFQMKFDHNFDHMIMDIPHWKSVDDIPCSLLQFIKSVSDKRVIYETSTGKFYCGCCAFELDENNYCKKCDILHRKYSQDDIENGHVDINVIDKIETTALYELDNVCHYFVFDIVKNGVYLYLLSERVSYYHPLSSLPYKSSDILIDLSSSYYIEQDGVINLETNCYTSFQLLDDIRQQMENDLEYDFDNNSFHLYEKFELNVHEAYFYTDNLDDLKDTIYKYSGIWKMKDYLKEQNAFTISQFCFYPLYYLSFEYLVNYKLYNLAWNVPHWFRNGKNFKEIFGVDKQFLPMMVENNISCDEFFVLRLFPTNDIEVLHFFGMYAFNTIFSYLVKEIKINLKILMSYLIDSGLSSYYLSDYFDYIHMAQELHLDLNDKKVLYPVHLQEAHDTLYEQVAVIEDPIIDQKIKKLSRILEINTYEDDDYIIYPATSIHDLVDESRQQKNCVRTYCELVSNNKSQIYFMRKKSEPDKSLVTIEVKDNKIIQARVKYNQLPSDELSIILRKWEKGLVPIVNQSGE